MFLGFLGCLVSLAVFCRASESSQSVLGLNQPPLDAYLQSAYAPVNDLSALSVDSFTTLRHPSFPNHSVRIKQTPFDCDSKSIAYTGYIDVGARHLFYFFFESRNDPATDDVILWINGGPGCISSMGAFMENGPCNIVPGAGLVYNPYSWTTNASVFYVDQPVGVGYSYAEHGEHVVSTTEEAAVDMAAFVAIFFETFRKFEGRGFHMAGESYAGHYLPIFAARIHDQNDQLIVEGRTPINLKSVMIGNGMVDYFTMYPSYIDFQCTTVAITPPISNISTCLRMKRALPRCQEWSFESCIKRFNASSCREARQFCDAELVAPLVKSGRNPYDITKKCEGPPSVHCYPVMQHLVDYLSLDTSRTLFGVDKAVPSDFAACNESIVQAFEETLDEYHETYIQISQLLERGVRTLIYVGTYDWICNWIGNERWTLEMPWSGQKLFVSQGLIDWFIDNRAVGKTRSANGLTYVTITGAGHMVPFDKPVEALVLVQKWLTEQPL